MEALILQDKFAPPSMSLLEGAAAYGLELDRGRVFTDLWDLNDTSGCKRCFSQRIERLRAMNLTQAVAAQVVCGECGDEAA
jgi:hypothetical protein